MTQENGNYYLTGREKLQIHFHRIPEILFDEREECHVLAAKRT